MLDYKKIDICIYENGVYKDICDFVKRNHLEKQFEKKYNCKLEDFDFDETDIDFFEQLDYLVGLLDTDTERYFTTHEDDSDYFRVDYVKLGEVE